jgi:predicted AAA+ superfamily ATPase
LKREIKSLIDVKDGNEKIILTLDHPDEAIIDGVKIINLIE